MLIPYDLFKDVREELLTIRKTAEFFILRDFGGFPILRTSLTLTEILVYLSKLSYIAFDRVIKPVNLK